MIGVAAIGEEVTGDQARAVGGGQQGRAGAVTVAITVSSRCHTLRFTFLPFTIIGGCRLSRTNLIG